MPSNWSWVIASYVLTFAALAGYVLYLTSRAREARQALSVTSGERA